MLAILQTILPIWLMILIGFVAVRSRYFAAAQIAGLGQFTLKVALIALIFQAIAVPRAASLNLPFLLAYGGAGLATMLLGFAALRLILRRPAVEGWVLAMGMGNSNSGFLGLPIAALVFGDLGAQVFAMTMLVENALTLPFAIAAAEAAQGRGLGLRGFVGQTLRRLVTNPLLVAVAAALVWRASGLNPGETVLRTLGLLAAAALPVALFVVGGTVAQMRAVGHWRPSLVVALGKLVLHPALVALAFALVPGVPVALVPVGILFAAVPMLTIYPILAAPFGQSAVASAAMIVTMAVSVVTVTLVLWQIAPI